MAIGEGGDNYEKVLAEARRIAAIEKSDFANSINSTIERWLRDGDGKALREAVRTVMVNFEPEDADYVTNRIIDGWIKLGISGSALSGVVNEGRLSSRKREE